VNSFQAGLLMPIGGAEDKTGQKTVLRRFLQWCGGTKAEIVVIPSASAFALDVGDQYCAVFAQMGARHVECLHIHDRSQSNSPELLSRLEGATGIFMTGGDQLKLASLLVSTKLGEAVRCLNASGIPVAGTSAGASAMSRQMIAFGRSGAQPSQRMVQLASGLGLTESLIIDQHFSQRNRLGRLTTAVALNPGMVGVGVDENTAFEIHSDGECEVVGAGTVTIVDGRQLAYTDIYSAKRYDPVQVKGIDVQVLRSGARYLLDPQFDLYERVAG
jgi:cyanophycinase